MIALVIRIAIIAAALLLAVLLVPDIEVDWSDEARGSALALLVLAVVFGLVNASVRPLSSLVSIPLNILTLGMFSVLLNAGLLLLVAFLVDLVWEGLVVVGGYPPDLSVEAVGTAAVASFIISIVAAALTILIPDA